jgi:HKD family nuclease
MIIQTPKASGTILSALKAAASPDVTEIRLAVAYVTLSGVRVFAEAMEAQMGAGWANAEKRLVTCIDFGLTDPEALRAWLNLANSSAFLHNLGIKDPRLRPSKAFHAKYYDFRRPGAATVAIGSANLSKAALTDNHEVLSVETFASLSSANAAWKDLSKGAVPATAAVIEAYTNRRNAISVPVTNSVYTSITPEQRLWDAIETGHAQPTNFEYFWLDTGSMTSGGSSNQLEMPRGGHRFFGGQVNYNSHSKKIIDVEIRVGGVPHDRPISWHGSNRMERLNLPTGIEYAGRVVLFKRLPSAFDLSVMPSGSPLAQSWSDRSEAVKQRFRVGRNSLRQCGFF